MKALVRKTLLLGIVGFGSFIAYHELHSPSILVLKVVYDGRCQEDMTTGSQWGNSLDLDSFGPGDRSYHLAVRILGGNPRHTNFSYHFVDNTSGAVQSTDGKITVGDEAPMSVQLDPHISLAAYVKPNL
jgi:hypothetical protein